MAEATMQVPAITEQKAPIGTIHVVDPHPLNWLYIGETDAARLNRLDQQMDRLAHDEVAETEVGEGHWSRRGGQ